MPFEFPIRRVVPCIPQGTLGRGDFADECVMLLSGEVMGTFPRWRVGAVEVDIQDEENA